MQNGFDWLVKIGEKDGENVYATSRWVSVNKYNADKSQEVDGSSLIIGDFNAELVGEVDAVGYAFFDADDNLIDVAKDTKVYQIKHTDDGKLYTVTYVDNIPDSVKLKSYAEMDGYAVVFKTDNKTLTK